MDSILANGPICHPEGGVLELSWWIIGVPRREELGAIVVRVESLWPKCAEITSRILDRLILVLCDCVLLCSVGERYRLSMVGRRSGVGFEGEGKARGIGEGSKEDVLMLE